MEDEIRTVSQDDEGELNFTTVVSNIQAILDEPEVAGVLNKIQMPKEDFLSEIIAEMESTEGGIAFANNETESKYSKKCVRVKVLQKLIEVEGRAAAQKLKEEPPLAEPHEVEKFLSEYRAAIENGSPNDMLKAVKGNMVVPIIDEDGNEIFIVLTPEQVKELSKAVVETDKTLREGMGKAKLQDDERDENDDKKVEAEEEKQEQEQEQEQDEATASMTENEKDKKQEVKDIKNVKTAPQTKKVTLETLGYKEYEVENTEYFEMHPEQRNATFVEPNYGEDITIFAKNLIRLQRDSDERIVGVFNGITLDVRELKSAAEIEATFNGALDNRREESKLPAEQKDIKEKGEFISLNDYYGQFYQSQSNVQSYVDRYSGQNKDPRLASHYDKVISMSVTPDKIDEFLEAAIYEAANSSGNVYVEIDGVVVCANDFKSVDELYKRIGTIQQSVKSAEQDRTMGQEPELNEAQLIEDGIDPELSQLNDGPTSSRINDTLASLTENEIESVGNDMNVQDIAGTLVNDSLEAELTTEQDIKEANRKIAEKEAARYAQRRQQDAERQGPESEDMILG